MRSNYSIIIGWLCLIFLAYISVNVKHNLSFSPAKLILKDRICGSFIKPLHDFIDIICNQLLQRMH